MPAIDFKEIPEAHLGSGLQDTFELFARDFLAYLGYEIKEDPSRGADGGKDLIVIERRKGIAGQTLIRWLVSCKHQAHSGTAVSPQTESNIRDRIDAHHCCGFIGFYSTLATSGLQGRLNSLPGIEIQIFDKEKIETFLLQSAAGVHLAKRYFPISIGKLKPAPAEIFSKNPELYCKQCGKNLLDPKPTGNIIFWKKTTELARDGKLYGITHYSHIYWCCKDCDRDISCSREIQKMKNLGYSSGWLDISDATIPTEFLHLVFSLINQLNQGHTYSSEAIEALKDFIASVSPYVLRNPTQEEQQKITNLNSIRKDLSGLI